MSLFPGSSLEGAQIVAQTWGANSKTKVSLEDEDVDQCFSIILHQRSLIVNQYHDISVWNVGSSTKKSIGGGIFLTISPKNYFLLYSILTPFHTNSEQISLLKEYD